MFKDTRAYSSFSVDDVDRAREFYGGTLGLETAMDEMGFMSVRIAGGNRLFVYPKADHVPAEFTVLNFPVDDVDAAVDALVERGIELERYDEVEIEGTGGTDERGILRGPGMAIAWFKDPAGNVLSVVEG